MQPIDDNNKGYLYVKNWRVRTKILLVMAFGEVCGCCGQKYIPKVFDFHHLDPKLKDINIGSFDKNASIKKILNEIPKCVMLCSNCHREVHAGVRNIPIEVKMFDKSVFEKLAKDESDDRKVKNTVIRKNTFNKRGCWENVDVITLRQSGRSWNSIAKEAKVSLASVQKRHSKLLGNHKYIRGPKRNIVWPDDETLKEQLEIRPATHIAKELGITSSAIKKRCKLRGIPTPQKGFWSTHKKQNGQ